MQNKSEKSPSHHSAEPQRVRTRTPLRSESPCSSDFIGQGGQGGTATLRVTDVYKNFGSPRFHRDSKQPAHPVEVLRGISFEIATGQTLAITGPSGSGKSTLLHLIGTLDKPSSGTIELNGEDPFALPEPQLARFRNQVIGFVFQDHYLLPQYSVLENVLIPTLAFKRKNADSGFDKLNPADFDGLNPAEKRARGLLERVGLANRLDHRPAELSGGERQRVAVARALIHCPSLLLCDEPTGSLDRSTANAVASLLFELHEAEGNILIVVTHSLELAARFERRFELVNGTIME